MIVSRSRASIICFGGWGLQVMLHLWPRLRFTQDERNYLGLPLPDLDRLATFACLMPLPYLKEQDGGKRRGFCLLEPHPDNYPEPFYVERQLSREIPALSGSYTYAERTAQMLLDGALDNYYVRHLSFKGIDSLQDRFLHQEVSDIDRRVSRRLMFRLGVAAAESVAQCIVHKVVNPTRLDQVQPCDPFVQTNIYVVAPLTEPLASAMIWPILAELIADLGRRAINSVIAFFLTGSFATDHTRAIEEASTYATLRELEIMSGLVHTPSELQPTLRELVKHKLGWESRIGQPLFDQIYLIDREKNNQSLANDAQELSVLVSNVIESFLVSNSSDYIQRYASQDYNHPYSIVGSANDYIPLREYYHAAIEEEKRRVIREAFLVDTPTSDTPLIELRELRIQPNEVINDLLSQRTNTILERLHTWKVFLSWLSRLTYLVYLCQQIMKRLGRPQPSPINHQGDTIPDVRIACSYITGRSEDFGERLRRVRKLWHWRSLIDERVLNLAKQLEQDIEQYFGNVWGTEYHHNRNQWWFGANKDIDSILQPYHSQTWIERYREDKRIVPQMTVAILRRLIEIIRRDTRGLNIAQNALNKLISDIEQILKNIRQHEPGQIAEQRNSFENRFRRWESDYYRIASRTPHHEAIIVRIASLAMLVSFTIIGWVLFEQQTAPTVIQIIVAGVFCAILIGLVLLFAYVPLLWSTHNIRSRRIKLAQKQLTDHFRELIRQKLRDVYQKMLIDIRILYNTVQQAKIALTKMTMPIDNSSVIPLSVSTNNLRRAHASEKIWSDVKQLVQGFRILDRVKESWSRRHSQQIANPDNLFIQRFCRALELDFNRRDLITAIELESERSSRSKDIIISDLTDGRWCPFAPDAPPDRAQQNSYCSACVELGSRCVFCKEGINIAGIAISAEPYDENSGSIVGGKLLAALIYELVADTINKLIPQQRSAQERLEFFRTLLTKYNIEQIIYDQNGVTLLSSRGFTEEFYERAKHTAHPDVCDTLHQDVREIEIVVTTDAEHSVFREEFERLGIRVLSSYDPASITIIRIVEGLKLSDLQLINRCQQDFSRLTPSDYEMIGLVEESMSSQLYIKDSSVIPYDEPAL